MSKERRTFVNYKWNCDKIYDQILKISLLRHFVPLTFLDMATHYTNISLHPHFTNKHFATVTFPYLKNSLHIPTTYISLHMSTTRYKIMKLFL
jgi:hypothetical protein